MGASTLRDRLESARKCINELKEALVSQQGAWGGHASSGGGALSSLQACEDELIEAGRRFMEERRTLNAVKRLYKELIDLAPESYLVTDPDGVILEVNNSAAVLFNDRKSVMRDKQITSFVGAEHLHQFKVRMGVIRTGVRLEWGLDLRDSHGVPFPAYMEVSPVQTSLGEVRAIRFLIKDQAVKRPAGTSRHYDGLLQEVMDNSTSIISIKDPEGRYVLINRGCERLLRISREEIVSMTDHDLFPKEVADSLRANDLKAVQMRSPMEFEEIFTARGEVRTFLAIKFPIYGGKGEIKGICAVSTDITQRKRYEHRISHLNKLLRTFYDINHLIIYECDPDRLLSEICRILVDHGGFPFCWVGMADFNSGQVHPVAVAGEGEGLLGGPGGASQGGPAAQAIRCGRYIISCDHEGAELPEAARRMGLRSSAAFPIIVRGIVTGAISIYSTEQDAFGPEVIEFLFKLSGNVGFALQSFEDIKDRRKAQAMRKASEKKFRNLMEGVHVGIALSGPSGEHIEANGAMAELFGYSSREEFLKTPVNELFDDPSAMCRMLEQGREGKPMEHEEVLRRKDGSMFWGSVTLITKSGGDGPQTIMVVGDISEKKASEEALRASDERFRQIFQQNSDAQMIFEKDGRIIDANPAAVALYGYTIEELMERGAGLFISPEETDRFKNAISGAVTEKAFSMDRMVHLKKDGASIISSVKGQAVTVTDSEVVYCTLRDITEKIRLEEETRSIQAKLIHANKMTSLGTLSSGVAHEINNPNNFILFNSTLLSDVWQDSVKILAGYYRENGDFTLGGLPFTEMCEVVPELLDGISDGARRIKGIVDNLRDFSRVDRSGALEDFNVSRAVMAAAAMLNFQINKYTDNFNMVCAEDLPPVRGSRQKIEQVVINLIMNALHALPERKCGVWVHTLAESGGVLIRIRDEGTGIPKEVMDRITEPFFTTKADTGGTGLGLSISYSIIRSHKGSLEFDSESGRGTTVTIRLPAAQTGCA